MLSQSSPTRFRDSDSVKPYHSKFAFHKIVTCQCSISAIFGKAVYNHLNSLAKDGATHAMKYGRDGRIHLISGTGLLLLSSKEKPNFRYISIWNYFCILSNTRQNCLHIPQIEIGHFIFYQNPQLGKFHGFMLQRYKQVASQYKKEPLDLIVFELFLAISKVRCDIMIYCEPQHCHDRSTSMPLQITYLLNGKKRFIFMSIELFSIITGRPQHGHSFPCENTIRRHAQPYFHASSSPKQSC